MTASLLRLGIGERCKTCGMAEGHPCDCNVARPVYDLTAQYAELFRVDPVKTCDLISHLRSGPAYLSPLTVEQAGRAVRMAIDLGWRPPAPADQQKATQP